jgi:FAD-linked oxidoreductase
MTAWRNWSGLQRANPAVTFTPVEETGIVAAVREARARGLTLRVVGSGHSFTPLCVTDSAQISLAGHSGVVAVEGEQATVKAGTTIRDLGPLLRARGLNLANQGDVDAQAIAGAIGTGTHGTGVTLGSVSTQATALRLVTAGGEIVTCSAGQDSDIFNAARVALGALGILSEVTLACRPAYTLHERQRTMALDEVLATFPEFAQAHRHAEFFWFPLSQAAVVKTLEPTDAPVSKALALHRFKTSVVENGALWAFAQASRIIPALTGPLARLSAAAGGSERIDHAERAFPSPRSVRFNEMEYAVPAQAGLECIAEIRAWFQRTGTLVYFPIEFRYVAADDIWLSPFEGRDCAAIAVHRLAGEDFTAYFAAMEAIFRNHQGRPHWGKLHTLKAAQLSALYPRWHDFQTVRQRLDPDGLFLNDYLRGLFEG